eukprot:GHRQ01036748.1.p3 GENE.GHRQ01036748.1~~GHRQ01036748.1.p3  ORF type:complete len:105 (-),score=29.93 GHRQ01036748.1:432-746(-)
MPKYAPSLVYCCNWVTSTAAPARWHGVCQNIYVWSFSRCYQLNVLPLLPTVATVFVLRAPAQAPQAGEISAYRAEEGDPVEYNQSVVEIAPYFGGHIIGDSKYA